MIAVGNCDAVGRFDANVNVMGTKNYKTIVLNFHVKVLNNKKLGL